MKQEPGAPGGPGGDAQVLVRCHHVRRGRLSGAGSGDLADPVHEGHRVPVQLAASRLLRQAFIHLLLVWFLRGYRPFIRPNHPSPY